MTRKNKEKTERKFPAGGENAAENNVAENNAENSENLEAHSEFPVLYGEEEWNAVEQSIMECFGKYENVFHEIASPDIHVDIFIVPPAPQEGRDYCTLITFGMGAYRMKVPEALAEQKLERAELFLRLPAGWRLDREALQDECWYWPVRLLKTTARLPIEEDSWLGWGHTIGMEEGETYADNTELCGCMLTGTDPMTGDTMYCELPNGDEVVYYQLVPLYEEEIAYKIENGADALLEKFPEKLLEVIDPARPNIIKK